MVKRTSVDAGRAEDTRPSKRVESTDEAGTFRAFILVPKSLDQRDQTNSSRALSAETVLAFSGDIGSITSEILNSLKGQRQLNLVVSKGVYKHWSAAANRKANGGQLPLTSDRLITVQESELGETLKTLSDATRLLQEKSSVLYKPLPTAGTFGSSDFFYDQHNRKKLDESNNAANAYVSKLMSKGSIGGKANLQDVTGFPNIATESGYKAALDTVEKAITSGSGGSVMKLTVVIPADTVGTIIGKSGTKIQEIRNTSGTQMRVFDPENDADPNADRSLNISGVPEQVLHAISLLGTLLKETARR